MKPIAIIAIIAAVVVVGGACAGVAFSGVLNGGTTGPGGDDPVVPTDPVDPTPTETPTETPTPTPTDSSMSYFSPMTSSGSSSGSSSSSNTGGSGDDETEEECSHAETKLKLNDDYTHSLVCKKCGVTITTDSCTYAHYQYAGKSTDGKPTHSMICDVCGNSVTGFCEEGRTTHVKEDGELKHSVKCKYCEGPYGESADCFNGENQLGWEWIDGTSSHKRTCVDCGETYIAECTYDTKTVEPSNDKSWTHKMTGECNGCNHKYTGDTVKCFITYVNNTTTTTPPQHDLKCNLCQVIHLTEKCENKTYTKNTDEGKIGTHNVTCTNCSGVINPVEACVFDETKTEYYLNSDKPKMIEFCKNCTYKKETFVEAKIGNKCYEHLADAIAEVQEGQTLEIICPKTYDPFTIDKSGVTIKGINTGNAATSTVIKNTADKNVQAHADGITLDSLYIDSTAEQTMDFYHAGAIDPYINTNSGTIAQDLTVTNCYMEGSGKEYHAIMYCGNNLEFTGNTVKNFVNGIQAMSDGYPPDEFVIKDNTFIDVDYAIGNQFYFGGSTSNERKGIVTITDNTVVGETVISVWDYAQLSGNSAFSDVTITGNDGNILYLFTHFNYKKSNDLTLTQGTGIQEVRNLSRVAFDIPLADKNHYTINKTDGSALDGTIEGRSTFTESITVGDETKPGVYFIASGDYLLVNTTSKVKYAFTVNDPVVDEQQYVELNTIVIADTEDMVNFATMVNAGETCAGKTVKLMDDIDLNNAEWTSIGSKDKPFAGTFDGQNYTISNMTANLFGTVSGTVKNLNVDTVTIENTVKNGANGFINTVSAGGLVDNCKVSNVDIKWTAEVNAKDTTDGFGGVIASVQAGATVQNCEFSDVTVTSNGKTKRTGAVFSSITGTVKGCVFTDVNFIVADTETLEGWVTSHGGGLAGDVNGGAVVEDCVINNMQINVYEAAGHVGGIFGKAHISGQTAPITLKDITVNGLTMNVGNTKESMKCVAGFIAQPDSRKNDVRVAIDNCHIYDLDMTLVSSKQGESAAAGFISGLCGGVDITNCSVSGKIDGTNTPANIGGFIGDAGWYGSIEQNFANCVANVDITVKDSIGGGFIAVDGTLTKDENKVNYYGGTATLNFVDCKATGTVTVVDGGTGTAEQFCGKTIE